MPVSILIALLALAIFIIYQLATANQKKLKKIREEWATGTFISKNEDFSSISSYWENKKNTTENYYGVDQLTWDDLGMDEVFKKLNYTQSSVGEEYLFNKLRDINPSEDKNHEQLYELLANHPEVREEITLILSKLGKQNHTNSSSFFFTVQDSKVKHPFLYISLALLPIAAISVLFFNLKVGLLFLFCSLLLNGIIYYRNKQKLENDLFSVGYIAAIIDSGKRLSSIKHLAVAEQLPELQSAITPLKKVVFLNKITAIGRGGGEFDTLFEYFRILFLLDFISYNSIMQAILKYQKEYKNIWEYIGELDAAIAVAFYRNQLQSYSKPCFTDKEILSFEEVAHPLLHNPIANTSSLGKHTLITGSNASGKSTYIKAVAINAIFAQTIHTVLAKNWTMKRSFVITSMAIQDSLLDGDSYFIAEIKSLKRIIKVIEDGKPCLSFIDEILKGTNTIERISASAAIMQWLSHHDGMNVLASHDIELTEIADSLYANYHFRETIADGAVRFDYKIHAGPSTTRNAIKLLEILDYPQSITNQANQLAEQFITTREWASLHSYMKY